MIRTLLCALALALALGACGSGDTFEPASTPEPTTSTTRAPEVIVVADRRFASLRWSGGSRQGTGTLVSRRWPRGADTGPWTFRFSLAGAPQGRVSITVRAAVPFGIDREQQVTLGEDPVTVDLRSRAGCSFSSCAPAAPTSAAVHVSPTGDDEQGDGSADRPFATIDHALDQRGTETVMLAEGTYRGWRDSEDRERPVTVTGEGTGRPTIVGAVLAGSGLRLRGLAFRGPQALGAKGDPAQDIEISQSTFTGPGYVGCLGIEPGSSRIVVRENWFRSCRNAIGGGYSGDPAGPDTTRVRIVGNLIEDLYGDGIQMTKWRDVDIRHNVIRSLRGREYDDHNDAVQIVGGAQQVRIVGNELRRSDNQLILIGEDFGLPTRDVLVANNILLFSGSPAVNVFGAEDVRILSNSFWGGAGGGTIYLGGNRRGEAARDTVIVNNILSRVFVAGDARAGRQERNLLPEGGPRDVIAQAPRFVDADRGDLRLRAGSPAWARADRRLTPETDIGGVVRAARTSIGAYR